MMIPDFNLTTLLFHLAYFSFAIIMFCIGYWIGRQDRLVLFHVYEGVRRLLDELRIMEPLILKRDCTVKRLKEKIHERAVREDQASAGESGGAGGVRPSEGTGRAAATATPKRKTAAKAKRKSAPRKKRAPSKTK